MRSERLSKHCVIPNSCPEWSKENSILFSGCQNFRDFLDRVPVARGDWHTEALLDLAEVTERLHLPTIQTQDESVVDRNDFQEPLVVRGQTERKRRHSAKSFG